MMLKLVPESFLIHSFMFEIKEVMCKNQKVADDEKKKRNQSQ